VRRLRHGRSRSVTVVRLFGLRKLPRIYRRQKELAAMQPGPAHKEIRLTYILIFPEHRSQGHGSSAVRLLINALLWETTNEIVTERITLFVRKANRAALLFRRAGFVPAPALPGVGDDPLATDPAVGPAELELARDRLERIASAKDTVVGPR
jgi:GNAT superfamily N-acetyltransferase